MCHELSWLLRHTSSYIYRSISSPYLITTTPHPSMPPQTHPKISLQPSPQTLPATRTLVNVHNDAFANDPWLELMYGPPDDDADYFAADMLDIMCGDPTARFMQAVVRSATSETDPNSETQTAAEKETETVVGWSWWNIYPSRSTYLGAAKQDKERAKKPPSTAISPAAYLDYKADVVDRREKWIENREGEGEGGVASMYTLSPFSSFYSCIHSRDFVFYLIRDTG